MSDIVNAEKRSQMMSGIRAKNTRPEMQVRQALFASGFRFRLHRNDLPGRPDITLPKFKAVIFVHGCFWHAHKQCKLAKIPATRPEFWFAKLEGNARRDAQAVATLKELGWRVLTVWECYLRATATDALQAALSRWISGSSQIDELTASPTSKA